MNSHFFGEWVEYTNEEEKLEAKVYLDYWIKFFVRKFTNMELGTIQWIDRPHIESFSVLTFPKNTLGVKIEMKGSLPKNVLSFKDLKLS